MRIIDPQSLAQVARDLLHAGWTVTVGTAVAHVVRS